MQMSIAGLAKLDTKGEDLDRALASKMAELQLLRQSPLTASR
jgi:hypothetical protein